MLYVVPTPIGNLSDISIRALDTLREVDLILSEDTRVAAKLLNHYDIRKPLRAYHSHNEHRTVEQIIVELQSGKKIALISDAGTPSISDPGYLLINACIERDIMIECLPGPTALITALVVSGLPAHRFYFEGFLPHKKGRNTRINFLKTLDDTIIFYESPHRIIRTVKQLAEALGHDRKSCLCRELTKLHEEVFRGSLGDLEIWLINKVSIKGELVLIVAGH